MKHAQGDCQVTGSFSKHDHCPILDAAIFGKQIATIA
jgi:hypothetical protein